MIKTKKYEGKPIPPFFLTLFQKPQIELPTFARFSPISLYILSYKIIKKNHREYIKRDSSKVCFIRLSEFYEKKREVDNG
jgi:hypothetical protein